MANETTVLGLGGAGLKMTAALTSLPGTEGVRVGGTDTDVSALEKSGLPNIFPVGVEWTRGVGCGGDPDRGARAFAHKSKKDIENFITGSRLLVVLGGAGGGAGTGGAPLIGRMARRLNVPAVFLLTLPFSFEGQARKDVAEEGLKHLLPDADVVVPVPNDILFMSLEAGTPAAKAFAKADESIAMAALGLATAIGDTNLISSDFADVKNLLGGKKSTCGIGLGVASEENGGADRCMAAVENLLRSPLLGGKKAIEAADAMMITIVGGDDLAIGEMKKALETLRHSSKEFARIVTGAGTAPGMERRVAITVLTIGYDAKTAPVSDPVFDPIAPTTRQKTVKKGELHQPDLLPEQDMSRGYFSKTAQNIIKGEDVDIPTFQRAGVSIDKGK